MALATGIHQVSAIITLSDEALAVVSSNTPTASAQSLKRSGTRKHEVAQPRRSCCSVLRSVSTRSASEWSSVFTNKMKEHALRAAMKNLREGS